MADLIARAFGLFSAALGLAALGGWILDLPLLASVRPDWIPMAPSTAALFILLGTGIFWSGKAPARGSGVSVAEVIGSASAFVAAVLFVLSSLGIRLEAEHLGLALTGIESAAAVGHMSPVSALCLVVGGVSLAFVPAHGPTRAMTGFWLAVSLFCASIVFLLAYMFGTPLFYGGSFIPPALTTSLGLAALSAALISLAWERVWAFGRRIDATILRESRPFVLVFALLAAGLVAAAYFQYRQFVAEHRAEVERELSAVAELKVRELANWRRERLADAASFSSVGAFADLVRSLSQRPGDANVRERIASWLAHIREAKGYDRASLLDVRGAQLISVPEGMLSQAERVLALRALDEGRPIVGDLYRDSGGEVTRLSILAPIAVSGLVLGVVALDIDPTRFVFPAIERWPSARRTAETLLVRRQGDDVLYLNQLRFRKGPALSLRLPVSRSELTAAKAVLGQEGILTGRNYRGEPVIAAARAVPGSPWFLIAQIERQEFLESMQQSLWFTAFLVGILLLAAGSSVGLIWRHQRAGHYRTQLETSEALGASLARYRALEHSAGDAIVTANAQGAIIGWNAAAERLFGYGAAEALGRPLTTLMPERYRAAHSERYGALQSDPGRKVRTAPLELHGLTKAGSEFPLELSLSTWEAPEGRLFTGILRDISDRKRAEQALTRRNDLYDMLSQTNQSIVRLSSREELFPAVCRIAVEHGRFLFAWVGVIQPDGTVKPEANYGQDAGYIDSLRVSTRESEPGGRGLAGRALRSGEHVLSNDFLADSAAAKRHEAARRSGVRAVGAFPIRERGVVAGIIVLAADAPGYFTDELLPTLDEMALDVSFALDNFERHAELARLVQDLSESEARYRSLFADSNVSMLLFDPGDGRIVDANVAACSFYGWDLPALRTMSVFDINALDRPRLELEIQSAREEKKEFHFRHRIAGGEIRDVDVFTGPVEVGGRSLLLSSIHDVTEPLRTRRDLAESEEQFRGLVEQTLAGIYILEEGRFVYANPRLAEILGCESAGELIGRDLLSFAADEERTALGGILRSCAEGATPSVNYVFTVVRRDGSSMDIGAQGARAMRSGRPAIIGLMQDISDKKRAEEQDRRYKEQLQNAFMQTVVVATTLVEMRDPYTAGHERRVANIAVTIGSELGLDERRLEGLRVAGYLHDIGKITVPTDILAKPGKLSAAEMELIQGHAQAGYDVLKGVEFPWPVAQMVLQHHERLDGSGYPQRLKGDQITFEARILAVADVLEAMASHRPYRPGLGIDRALAEVERGKGTLYDLAVAEACLHLYRDKGVSIPD